MIGAGQTLGRFQAVLGLDATNYAKGIINANSLNKVFGENFTAFVSNPVLGGIQILKNFGTVVVRAAGQQLALAETLQRTAQATGASEQLLIALNKRLEVAGYNADIGAKALQKFGTELFNFQRGSGPLKEVADSMGLVLDASAPLETNLRTLLDAIAQLPSETQRSAAAAKVFGEEAGPKLLNAIGGGSDAINRMIREAQQLGYTVDKVGNDQVAGMNTQLGYLNLALQGIKQNAVQNILIGLNEGSDGDIESILELSDSFNRELAPAARDIGASLGPVIEKLPAAMRETAEYMRNFVEGWQTLQAQYEGSWLQGLVEIQGEDANRKLAGFARFIADPSLENAGRLGIEQSVPIVTRKIINSALGVD